MWVFKKNPKRVRVESGFLFKKPKPNRDLTRLKTRYPELQKYPKIYIYTYNQTLTNSSFLHSSIFSCLPPSPQSDPQSLSLISALCNCSPISSVQSRLPPTVPQSDHASCLTPHSDSPSRLTPQKKDRPSLSLRTVPYSHTPIGPTLPHASLPQSDPPSLTHSLSQLGRVRDFKGKNKSRLERRKK